MNPIKTSLAVALLLAAGPVTSIALHAQSGQTAEGAQQFFAQLVQGGRARVEGRFEEKVPIRVSGVLNTKTGKKDWYGFDKYSQRPASFDGFGWANFLATGLDSATPCVSVLNGITYSSLYETEVTKTIDGYVDSPVQTVVPGREPQVRIDWGRVNVSRQPDGIAIHWADPTYKSVTIWLKTAQGAEMIDRMEYAGKFLQMSCDATSGTGF